MAAENLARNPLYLETKGHFRGYGGKGATFYGSPNDDHSRYAVQTFAKLLDNLGGAPVGLESEVLDTGRARISIDGKRRTVSTETREIRLRGKRSVKLILDTKGSNYNAKLRIHRHNVSFNEEIDTPFRKALRALME